MPITLTHMLTDPKYVISFPEFQIPISGFLWTSISSTLAPCEGGKYFPVIVYVNFIVQCIVIE